MNLVTDFSFSSRETDGLVEGDEQVEQHQWNDDRVDDRGRQHGQQPRLQHVFHQVGAHFPVPAQDFLLEDDPAPLQPVAKFRPPFGELGLEQIFQLLDLFDQD